MAGLTAEEGTCSLHQRAAARRARGQYSLHWGCWLRWSAEARAAARDARAEIDRRFAEGDLRFGDPIYVELGPGRGELEVRVDGLARVSVLHSDYWHEDEWED